MNTDRTEAGHGQALAERRAFLEALEGLERALIENADMRELMLERIAELRRQIDSGRPVREIIPREPRPMLIHRLTKAIEMLHVYGNAVRRTEARVLQREGLTMDEIARLFGVSRQRVSALLRERNGNG